MLPLCVDELLSGCPMILVGKQLATPRKVVLGFERKVFANVLNLGESVGIAEDGHQRLLGSTKARYGKVGRFQPRLGTRGFWKIWPLLCAPRQTLASAFVK